MCTANLLVAGAGGSGSIATASRRAPNDIWVVTIDGAGESLAQMLIGGDGEDHDIMASSMPDGGLPHGRAQKL